MKIESAVFFTDNKVVRLETKDKNYYLTDGGKVYDMHPINEVANEISGSLLTEIKKAAKGDSYKDSDKVKKWV